MKKKKAKIKKNKSVVLRFQRRHPVKIIFVLSYIGSRDAVHLTFYLAA